MPTPFVLLRRSGAWLAACVALLTPLPSAPTPADDMPPSASANFAGPAMPRPRIGLVLSGGGARGLAHVGVLKVLERERVPIHAIVGTSMGAIIGGLYASGMRADELERELVKLNWDEVFAPRVERRELPHRRKEEDFEISPVLEFGMRDGQFKAPLGALSGRGLESLLRRFTLPTRDVVEFDALPIPFRAVATDMESGRAVVLASGDLALALRSSMSIPGLFAPTEVQGRLLGDGGLVNNLPIDVARQMGADVVIAVNVGTPLATRTSLGSATGMTAQMINILTEQNVRRGVDALTPRDVLITPALAERGASDFVATRELIGLGAAAVTSAVQQRLAELVVSIEAHEAWRAKRPAPPTPTLRFVRFEGSTLTNPSRFARRLESAAGLPFDPDHAERDARRLAASGDYVRADYRLVNTPDGDGLVFELDDKPWGPHYFRVGLDLNTNFAGQGAFNLKVSHNRHWLDAHGTEWRNQIQIGAVPRWASELYRPLSWTRALLDDGFVASYGELERRELAVYNNQSGRQRGRFNRGLVRAGIDLGQPWGQIGELRLGVTYSVLRTTPDLLAADYTGPREPFTTREGGVRLRAVIDQLDFATFPQHGYRVETEITVGQRSGTVSEPFRRIEAQAMSVGTWSRHTFDASVRLQYAGQGDFGSVGRYSLGGFQQLSGYEPGQINGNYLLFGRLIYTHRLDESPVFTRGWFGGATLEAGNAWDRRADAHVSDLRLGTSAFIGAATGLGPLYFGVTYAPKGSAGVILAIGRP